jgi:hypothetical protein
VAVVVAEVLLDLRLVLEVAVHQEEVVVLPVHNAWGGLEFYRLTVVQIILMTHFHQVAVVVLEVLEVVVLDLREALEALE